MTEKVRHVRRAAGQIQYLSNQGELLEATELTVETEKELGERGRRIKAFGVLANALKDLRHDIGEALDREWHVLIRIEAHISTLCLPHELQCKHSPVIRASILTICKAISTIARAMENFGLLGEHIDDLTRQLEVAILLPCMQLQDGIHERLLAVDSNTLKISESASPLNLHRLIDDLSTLIAFLEKNLPPSVVNPLSKVLTPMLVERLISLRLSAAIPEDLSALRGFDSTREEIDRFSETVSSHGWPGGDKLHAWINSVPQLWVQQRQRSSLDSVRKLLNRGYGEIKTVERVETQLISHQDHLFNGNTSNDNWNAGWSDEDYSSPTEKKQGQESPAAAQEGEDVSAWGLDDEAGDDTKSKSPASSAESDEENDAWGWGDDKNVMEGASSPRDDRKTPSIREPDRYDRDKTQRKLTLRESYNITALPVDILDLINRVIFDVDELNRQK